MSTPSSPRPRERPAAASWHWREYLMEAAELGLFMLAACAAVFVLEHPGSAVRRALPEALDRRAIAGVAMGLTAIAIIYSPWGRRSGAHFNPCVTLSFYRLGRVPARDAVFYVAGHFAGAVAGVALAHALFGPALADRAVAFAATVPGPAGAGVAFVAELAISFVLMLCVLAVSASRFARATGLVAGCLVAFYIVVEGPLSGMSMNPARTVGSAVFARQWQAVWVYFVAPAAGMLLAAEVHARAARRAARGCAKLCHDDRRPCIFCLGAPARARD